MKTSLHNILGTEYTVMFGSRKELNLSEEYMGECHIYSKKILVCTEIGELSEEELRVRVQEILSHEFLHAYLNEAGVDLVNGDEEKVCDFYMKNWRKLNNSILEVLDENGFLDN